MTRSEDSADPSFTHEVCIVGVGRVGLPLALSLLEEGVSVIGVDRDPDVREAAERGVMPWREPGYDDLMAKRELKVFEDPSVVSAAQYLIITVGTPLYQHVESDLSQVSAVLDAIAPHLRPGHVVCLRSTVSPGTTAFVAKWLRRETGLILGEELMLAFCPERIAEGRAYEELRTLHQVIGASDDKSHEMAAALFGRLAPSTVLTDPVSAELVKLFTNMVRYVNFAVANQLTLVAEAFDANIYDIREMANLDYPREHIPKPGLTAGSCLRKDFGMLSEWSAYPDLFLMAWKVNEHMPVFLTQRAQEHIELHDRRVAVLGWSFKANTDDARDSLSPKLVRYLRRHLPAEIRISDYHLPAIIADETLGRLVNWPAEEALDGVDVVFVAVGHEGYGALIERVAETAPGTWFVDLWNVGNRNRIVYQAGQP